MSEQSVVHTLCPVSVAIEQTADRIARELGPLSRDQRIALDRLLDELAGEVAALSTERLW